MGSQDCRRISIRLYDHIPEHRSVIDFIERGEWRRNMNGVLALALSRGLNLPNETGQNRGSDRGGISSTVSHEEMAEPPNLPEITFEDTSLLPPEGERSLFGDQSDNAEW